jgi:hypothetical protein
MPSTDPFVHGASSRPKVSAAFICVCRSDFWYPSDAPVCSRRSGTNRAEGRRRSLLRC